jgi:hypothetical protein
VLLLLLLLLLLLIGFSGEHVDELWYAVDGRVIPAKVKGALEGEAREALWNEHRAFVIKFKEESAKEEGKEEK